MGRENVMFITFLVAVIFPENVTFMLPFDAAAGKILHLRYGARGPPHADYLREIMTRTTGDMIERYGYPYRKHMITTSDGYVLEMHRIPNYSRPTRPPIILVPGILLDSGSYVMNGNENSPAFIFWNAGYDVWLHNNRGTRYGLGHLTLSHMLDKEFWDFSFHEMGVYDLRAAVNYVRWRTNSNQVYLVGHSMGGTAITVFLAENPADNYKVKAAFLLAPEIFMEHTKMSLVRSRKLFHKIFFRIMDDTEVLPYSENMMLLLGSICKPLIGTKWLRFLMDLLFNVKMIDEPQDVTLEKISKLISGTSIKTRHHFIQLANKDSFSKFDYGPKGNGRIYGTEHPPDYRLDYISVPIVVIFAEGDSIVNRWDALKSSNHFKSLVSRERVNDDTFDHMDFLLSPYTKFYVYHPILDHMFRMEQYDYY